MGRPALFACENAAGNQFPAAFVLEIGVGLQGDLVVVCMDIFAFAAFAGDAKQIVGRFENPEQRDHTYE